MTVRPNFFLQSGRAKTKLALATALIPLVCSIAAHASAPLPRPFAVKTPPATLAFTQYLVDKGLVDPTAEENARYGFVNRGNTPVIMTKISVSCGCLKPEVIVGDQRFRPNDKDELLLPIPPGEQGMILLRVQMANQEPGHHEYTLTVETRPARSKESQSTDLAFQLRVPDRGVTVRPASMVLYHNGGRIEEQSITVTDMRPDHFRVEGVSCDSDLVQLRTEDAVADENGFRRIPIKLAVSDQVPPGKHVTVVRIFTDDPEYPELRVPLWIYGPKQSNAQISTGEAPAKH